MPSANSDWNYGVEIIDQSFVDTVELALLIDLLCIWLYRGLTTGSGRCDCRRPRVISLSGTIEVITHTTVLTCLSNFHERSQWIDKVPTMKVFELNYVIIVDVIYNWFSLLLLCLTATGILLKSKVISEEWNFLHFLRSSFFAKHFIFHFILKKR